MTVTTGGGATSVANLAAVRAFAMTINQQTHNTVTVSLLALQQATRAFADELYLAWLAAARVLVCLVQLGRGVFMPDDEQLQTRAVHAMGHTVARRGRRRRLSQADRTTVRIPLACTSSHY